MTRLIDWFMHRGCAVLVGAVLMVSPVVMAASADERGLAIATERKQRDTGWGNSVAEMTMVLRNKNGDESVRKMRIKSLEVDGDGDKGLTVFNQPRDVKGTAFLTFSHTNKPDDQWLYLPALKRVKRISSRNKSGPFMGSEFAYEDLSSFELEKYSYTYLKDEQLDGEDCYVVQQTPVDRYSGYTKMVVWIDKAAYRVRKVDFYDRKRALLKTLSFTDYRQYLDKFWRADVLRMVNHQTAKTTEMITHEMRFNTGLRDRDFNKNSLKRAR